MPRQAKRKAPSRQSPKVAVTIPAPMLARIDAMVAEDAAEQVRDPKRFRSAWFVGLALAEEKRRAEAKKRTREEEMG